MKILDILENKQNYENLPELIPVIVVYDVNITNDKNIKCWKRVYLTKEFIESNDSLELLKAFIKPPNEYCNSSVTLQKMHIEIIQS